MSFSWKIYVFNFVNFSTLEENHVTYSQKIKVAEKEISALKKGIKKASGKLKSGENESKKEADLHKEKLESAQVELAKMKLENETLKTTVGAIQGFESNLMKLWFNKLILERFEFAANEAERYKEMAEKKKAKLSSLLHEVAAELEMEFEKPANFGEMETMTMELDALRSECTTLTKKIDSMVTCPICDEKFQSRNLF